MEDIDFHQQSFISQSHIGEDAMPSDEIATQMRLQREDFDALAERAQLRFAEQKDALDTARNENSTLHKMLHETEEIVKEATAALEEEVKKRKRLEGLLQDLSNLQQMRRPSYTTEHDEVGGAHHHDQAR